MKIGTLIIPIWNNIGTLVNTNEKISVLVTLYIRYLQAEKKYARTKFDFNEILQTKKI